MEVTSATIDEDPQRTVPARFMHRPTQFIYVAVPITDMTNSVGAASQAVSIPKII